MQTEDEFVKAVYEVVKTIPYGRATSYGAIAKAIGYPNMSRKVGKVMGNCCENIAAYRVVSSAGILSGREAFGNGGEMQKLLEAEGIVITNNRIKNWKTIFWDPLEEINI